MTPITDIFTVLPVDLQKSIATLTGAPFTATKGFSVKSREIPYVEIWESFQKEMGQAKCNALVNDVIAKKMPIIRSVGHPSSEQKIRAICKDICIQCKQFPSGEDYLATKHLDPIFCASSYHEIEQWIADENLLLICPRLLGDDWRGIEGNHAQRAQIARKMLAERRDSFTHIDLSNLGLTQVPPEVFTLRNLINLNLSFNKLTSFDVAADAFPTLQLLDLKCNQLATFNVAIGALSTLETLFLTQNQLTSFNSSGNSFPSLSTLNVNHNQLTDFNAQVDAYPMLRDLGLENNLLKSFNPAIGAFPNLVKFDLNNNFLNTFNITANVYPALRHLWLGHNELTNFNVPAGAFPELNRLSLTNNQLTNFNAGANAFPNLRDLYLDYNKLTNFNADANPFPNLRELLLHDNELTTFHAFPGAYPELRQLQLGNPLTTFNAGALALPNLGEVYLADTLSTLNIDASGPSLRHQIYKLLPYRHRLKPRHWRLGCSLLSPGKQKALIGLAAATIWYIGAATLASQMLYRRFNAT